MSNLQTTSSNAAAAPNLNEVPEDAVADRAYRLWQQRGCPVGDAEQDWFAARAELETERLTAVAPETDARVVASPKKN